MTKKEIVQLLKTGNFSTYKELAKTTGYHEKSLIRINSELTSRAFEESEKKKKKELLDSRILAEFTKKDYRSFIEFYKNNKKKLDVSYSYMTKVLRSYKCNIELVIIEKLPNKNNLFRAIDCQRECILFERESLKNDTKTIKRVLFDLLSTYGAPKNICFVNCALKNELLAILERKYKISIVSYKKIFRCLLKRSSRCEKKPKYHQVTIDKTDFYDCTVRKTISPNVIQFDNTRYTIKGKKSFPKNRKIILYFDDKLHDILAFYDDEQLELEPLKTVKSLKGNTKY